MLKRKTLHVIILCCYVTSIFSVTISTDNQTTTVSTTVKSKLLMNALISRRTLPASTNQREIRYVSPSVLKNCILIPQNPDVSTRIKNILANGAKLIKFNIQFSRHEQNFSNNLFSSMYKPFQWMRSSGRHGNGLLLLQPKYVILSLTTLELGVETEIVRLKEWPSYCMDTLNYTDIELLIRELVMNDFHNTSNFIQLNPTDSICNMYVRDNKGTAIFQYMCCKRSASGYTTCDYLKEDISLKVLFWIIFCFKVIVVLCSPRYVPGSFYREKHIAAPYLHTLDQGQGMKLNIVKTKTPNNYPNVSPGQVFKLKKFKTMKTFKVTIQKMSSDVPCVMTLKEVCLRIKQKRLLSEGRAPVGIFKLINESLLKCKIRERRSFTECCSADIFSNVGCKTQLSWYRLIKSSMKIVVLLLSAVPWMIRVYEYYRFENKEWSLRKSIAHKRNLSFYFPGNFALYVTPLHVIFISVYVLLSLESCLFGLLPLRTKEICKFVLRKCFREMREMRKFNVISWVIRFVLKPCTSYGGLGICIALIIWLPALPFAALILSLYLFPTLNITVRLLCHFAVYILPRNSCSSNSVFARCSAMLDEIEKQSHTENIVLAETNENWLKSASNVCFKLIVIFFCLLSLYSVIFLVMELTSFMVEVFVYTIMGLIINASSTLKYISLVLLLGAYGVDCFGSVAKKYQRFSEIMHGVVMDLAKKQAELAMYESAKTDNNYAFKVKTRRAPLDEQPVKMQKNSEGLPKWKVDQLVLFLSKKNKPLIPKKLYFQLCKMPYHAVPGDLLKNYIEAAKAFGIIVIFLAFVLIVVLAFRETYNISSINKLLATIAGGFFPLLLRKFVFKSYAISEIDTDNVHFKVCLNNVLDAYIQSWPVFDIDASIADNKNDVMSGQPQPESNNGNNDTDNCAEPEASFIEKNEQTIKKENRVVNGHIDVLIDIS